MDKKNLKIPPIIDKTLIEPDSQNSMPLRILVAEDDAANAMVAEELLTIFGYQADIVFNGIDAVSLAKTGLYSIIMMDVRMHDLDGFEATRRIRKHEQETGSKPVSILCVTAYAFINDRIKCLEAGMDDYLAKPYKIDELELKLSQMAKRHA